MTGIDKILQHMRREPANIRFSEPRNGPPRQQGSRHLVFKTPWPGDPRVNIQDASGKAKPYQVKQALQAITQLECKS